MDQPPAYSPQNISDILPIYRPQDSDGHIRTYKLRQTSATIQKLIPTEESGAIPYTIQTRATGGFMNRKPHVIISESDGSSIQAEGRFESGGTGTTIIYLKSGRTQTLDLENSQTQLLKTTIGRFDHWWQPHPGNRNVLELTNEMEEIVARFIYTAPALQPRRPSSVTSVKKGCNEEDLGELSIVEELSGGNNSREEIVCSAVVVIDRARRRAKNMCGFASPAVPGGFL